jgi:hypothetical protein
LKCAQGIAEENPQFNTRRDGTRLVANSSTQQEFTEAGMRQSVVSSIICYFRNRILFSKKSGLKKTA